MQLNNPKSIRGALAVAGCSVLGTANAVTPNTGDWDVDATFLHYAEKDRVSVYAPGFIAKKAIGEDEYLSATAILDTLTGASPTGAAPGITAGSTVQTVTSPSGSQLTYAPGELPLTDFSDTRASLSLNWDKPLSRLQRNSLTGTVSSETDYFSLGLSDTYSREFNNRQTTLALGAGVTLDWVIPQAGAPVAMQSFSEITYLQSLPSAVVTTTSPSGGGEGVDGEPKNTFDVMVGVTQVINRRTLVQLNYSHAVTSGYLQDPYKYLSIVDPNTGETLDYMFEGRPESRSTNVLYGKVVYHLPEDVVHASVRFFSDDWGITSTTLDLNYRYELPGGMYLKPNVRLYNQSAADFYRHSLVAGTDAVQDVNGSYIATIAEASSDMRLADMSSTTIGLKFGMPVGEGDNAGELSVRVAQMVQTGESSPADAIGVQRNYDMYPDLEATVFQVNYSFVF